MDNRREKSVPHDVYDTEAAAEFGADGMLNPSSKRHKRRFHRNYDSNKANNSDNKSNNKIQ